MPSMILLSMEILLFCILLTLFAKNKSKNAICTIMWTLAGITILTPTFYVIYNAQNVVLKQVFLSIPVLLKITPISALLIALLGIIAVIAIVYQLFVLKKSYNSRFYPIMTAVFALGLFNLTINNILFYLVSLILIGIAINLIYRLDFKRFFNKFLFCQFAAILLIASGIITTSLMLKTFNMDAFAWLYSVSPSICSTVYILLFLGYLIYILTSELVFFDNYDSENTPLLSKILIPSCLKIIGIYGLYLMLINTCIPNYLTAVILLVCLGIGSVLLIIKSSKAEAATQKLLFMDMACIFSALAIYNTVILLAIKHFDMAAILCLFVTTILLMQNILLTCLTTATDKSQKPENGSNYMLPVLWMYSGAPFSGTFLCYPLAIFVLSTILVVNKSANIVEAALPLILILSFTAALYYVLFKFIKNLKNESEIKSPFFDWISGIFFVLILCSGIFITAPTKLALLPTSYIINFEKYRDFYLQILDYSYVLQKFMIFAFAAILVLFIIKKYILKK